MSSDIESRYTTRRTVAHRGNSQSVIYRRILVICVVGIVALSGCPLDELLMGDQDISEDSSYLIEIEIRPGSDGGPSADADVVVEYPGGVKPGSGTPAAYDPAQSRPVPDTLSFEGIRNYDDPGVISVAVSAVLNDPEAFSVRIWYSEPGTSSPERPRTLLAGGSASADPDTGGNTFTVTLSPAVPY